MTHADDKLRAWGPLPQEGDFVVRQSTFSNMDLCGGRTGLAQDLDLADAPPSEAMFGGTGIHLVIDNLIDNLFTPYSWMMNSVEFEDRLIELAQEKDGFDLRSRFSSGPVMRGWVEGLLDMGHKWLEQWGEPNLATIEQALVREDKLYRPLGLVIVNGTSRRCWVSGHPDLATPSEIVDWKTSSRDWQKGKAQGQIQDDIYATLVEWAYPEAQINQGLFVVGDRSKGTWREHHTLVTEASKKAALDRALNHCRDLLMGTYNMTPLDNFGKRGWHCKPQYCGAWDACTSRYLGDEFDILPQETRSQWL